MGRSKWKIRAFHNTLDQGAFVAYFLGGVVPLAVLGVVVDRYALSPATLPPDGYSSAGLLGLVLAICLLSLSSFFWILPVWRCSSNRV